MFVFFEMLFFLVLATFIALLHVKLKQDQGKKQMSGSLSSKLHPILVTELC